MYIYLSYSGYMNEGSQRSLFCREWSLIPYRRPMYRMSLPNIFASLFKICFDLTMSNLLGRTLGILQNTFARDEQN